MSNLLEKLFYLAMEELPSTSAHHVEKLETALVENLGKDSLSRFQAYKDALMEESWEDSQNLFFLALSLGIELGTLTPSADASRR